MYDRNWARSIVEQYQKFRPRAEQIDLCLQQLYQTHTHRYVLRKEIQDILVDSVQGKARPSLWNDYKRLVRKSPLDKELLEKVYRSIQFKVDVDKLQRQFDFS